MKSKEEIIQEASDLPEPDRSRFLLSIGASLLTEGKDLEAFDLLEHIDPTYIASGQMMDDLFLKDNKSMNDLGFLILSSLGDLDYLDLE